MEAGVWASMYGPPAEGRSMDEQPTLSLTVRIPPTWAARTRAIAARELTQAATIWRRVIRLGLEAEEARIESERQAT